LEIEELKLTIKRFQDSKKDDKKKLADDDAVRKIRILDDQVHTLSRQVMAKRNEEETLITEMEVTGQAFEDMQEANSRLIQQLREKDDANFKLMSDRIKANQLQKFEREQRDLLQDLIVSISNQLEAQNLVIRKLEEKERYLLNSVGAMEKEGAIRTQASESYKRKFIESAQSSADIRLHLDKYQSQMKDTLQAVTEKTWALEAEAYKSRRLKEEVVNLKGKLETLSKVEFVANSDEVMVEELRSLKESLTCPSCKVKRKDAVLAKCFHVFCFDCLRTRYEMRQRKCPKCNAAFGANDYHRLYLT
jgi:E3 ubiquitin-protein ligase BRE1